ncbi:MAG TPA: prepilin-type N-terminal cleavage/methylation domain-containing protein [Gemmatimonadales bacterium]|nr:prepilin-type N-terminal cleavage/methylation domain-containing protein [Gemmatimonadales bacterium]
MRDNRGVALLEVLVALVILATAGIGLIELVGAGLRGEHDAQAREATLATEERLLAALTLLRRHELDQRLGRRVIGEFIADIQRPEPTLYRIALLQQTSPHVEDLVTVVYRRTEIP